MKKKPIKQIKYEEPEPYTPKTEKEKEEAYKLLDDFQKALARRVALKNVAEQYISEPSESPRSEEEEKAGLKRWGKWLKSSHRGEVPFLDQLSSSLEPKPNHK
jgi:hypothetical protein